MKGQQIRIFRVVRRRSDIRTGKYTSGKPATIGRILWQTFEDAKNYHMRRGCSAGYLGVSGTIRHATNVAYQLLSIFQAKLEPLARSTLSHTD